MKDVHYEGGEVVSLGQVCFSAFPLVPKISGNFCNFSNSRVLSIGHLQTMHFVHVKALCLRGRLIFIKQVSISLTTDSVSSLHHSCPDEGISILRASLKEKLQKENGLNDVEVMVTAGEKKITPTGAPNNKQVQVPTRLS